jgi:hypothetical protein
MTDRAYVCTRCGRPVRIGQELCDRCIDEEAKGWSKAQAPRPSSLPGCVTIYAVLTLFSGALMLCSIVALMIQPQSAQYQQMANTYHIDMQTLIFISMLANGLMGIFYLLVGAGLFMRQNWARWGVVIVSVLGAIYSLAPLIIVLLTPGLAAVGFLPAVCIVLPGLLINGYIAYWFVFNGEYFVK